MSARYKQKSIDKILMNFKIFLFHRSSDFYTIRFVVYSENYSTGHSADRMLRHGRRIDFTESVSFSNENYYALLVYLASAYFQ